MPVTALMEDDEGRGTPLAPDQWEERD